MRSAAETSSTKKQLANTAKTKAQSTTTYTSPGPEGNPGVAAAAATQGQTGTSSTRSRPPLLTVSPTGSGNSTVTTPNAPAAAQPTPPPQPYLLPADMSTFEKGYSADQEGINSDIATMGNDRTAYNQDLTNNQTGYNGAYDTSDQNAAARGLGESSIREGALNDLAATYSANAQQYFTNYNTAVTNGYTDIGNKQTDQGQLVGTANTAAVTNAEAEDPNYTSDVSNSGEPAPTFDINPYISAALGNTPQSSIPDASTYTVGQPTMTNPFTSASDNFTTNAELRGTQATTATGMNSNAALAGIASQRAGFTPGSAAPAPTATTPLAPKPKPMPTASSTASSPVSGAAAPQ